MVGVGVPMEEEVVVVGMAANQHFNEHLCADGAGAFTSGTERAFLTHISFLNLAERLSQDSTFRQIGSEKIWDRRGGQPG